MFAKIVTVVLLLLAAVPSALADLGHSTVYAVCRITMRNGAVLEGAIRIAAGGYEKELHANGFYVEFNGAPYVVNMFSPAFRSIDLVSGNATYEPAPEDRATSFPPSKGKLSYLRTVPIAHYVKNANEDVQMKSAAKTGVVLDRTITQRKRYLLTDYIPVYSTVSAQNYDIDPDMMDLLPSGNRPQLPEPMPETKNIRLADIAKLELVTNPSEKWTKAIAKERDRLNAQYEQQGLEEWLLPVWFHEIQPGSDQYDYYKHFQTWEH